MASIMFLISSIRLCFDIMKRKDSYQTKSEVIREIRHTFVPAVEIVINLNFYARQTRLYFHDFLSIFGGSKAEDPDSLKRSIKRKYNNNNICPRMTNVLSSRKYPVPLIW